MMRTQPAITRPWFGAWPPEPYREPTAEMDDEKSTSDRTVQLVLALMALAGLAIHGGLYAAHDVIDHAHPLVRGAAHMVEYVAHGLVVAAILGIVVDHFLKQKLQEEVFKATLGYLLPPALRSAMEWMYSQQVICTYCRVNVTLRPLDDQSAVWVDVEITRRLQNASGNDAAVPMYFEIDNDVVWLETYLSRRSRLTAFALLSNGRNNRTLCFRQAINLRKFVVDRFECYSQIAAFDFALCD